MCKGLYQHFHECKISLIFPGIAKNQGKLFQPIFIKKNFHATLGQETTATHSLTLAFMSSEIKFPGLSSPI